MNASDEASDPFERLAVFQLGAAPAAARVHGEAEPGMLASKGRRDDRNFMLRQFSDRKSTRLNSSHSQISYAVFCLKKKNNTVNCHKDRVCTSMCGGGNSTLLTFC